jgi:REG-2-like HAD superfamily hydrolase
MGSTLVSFTTSFTGIYHQVFQRAGYDIPIGEVEQAVRYSWDIVSQQDSTAEFERTVEANRRWQQEVEQRVMQRLQIHPEVHEDIFWKIIEAFETPESYVLYPEVKSVLQKLRTEGYRLGMISNWSWHLPELCQQLGIDQYFDYICTSARAGYAKPRREIFEDALRNTNADPKRSLHIGDNYGADVEGAWSVEMAALWLVRPAEPMRFAPQQPLNELQQAIQIADLEGLWPHLEKGVPVGN